MSKQQLQKEKTATSMTKEVNSGDSVVMVIPIFPGYRWIAGILGLVQIVFAGFLFIWYFKMSMLSTLALAFSLLAAAWTVRAFRPASSFAETKYQRYHILLFGLFSLISFLLYRFNLYSNRYLSAFGEMMFTAFLGASFLGAAWRKNDTESK